MDLDEAWGNDREPYATTDGTRVLSARVVTQGGNAAILGVAGAPGAPGAGAQSGAPEPTVEELLALLRREQRRQHRTLVIGGLLMVALALMHVDALHRQLRKELTEGPRPR